MDLIIDSLGGKGDEPRREIGHEFLEVQAFPEVRLAFAQGPFPRASLQRVDEQSPLKGARRGMYSSGQFRPASAELMPRLYSEDLNAAMGIYRPERTFHISIVCLSTAASAGRSSSVAKEKDSRSSASFLAAQGASDTGREVSTGYGRIAGRIGIVGDQPLRPARKKTQQGNAVDAEEPQDRFQGVSDFVIHLFGGQGDELRGEIGQELFKLQALFGCSPPSWMYSILSVH